MHKVLILIRSKGQMKFLSITVYMAVYAWMVFVHKQFTLFSLMDGSEHRKIQKTMAEKASRRFKAVQFYYVSFSVPSKLVSWASSLPFLQSAMMSSMALKWKSILLSVCLSIASPFSLISSQLSDIGVTGIPALTLRND